jgi:hypothetical protein
MQPVALSSKKPIRVGLRPQHDEELLAAHEAEAFAAEPHRQVDEHAVIGDRDQHPGHEQRDAAAAKGAGKQG